MRFHRTLLGLGVVVSLSGCFADERQRLDAEGVVVDAEGAPLAGAAIDAYSVYFEVAGGIEIERRFVEDASAPAGIRTDGTGRFQVEAPDLALSYDWERDEYVCQDGCAEWGTSCTPIAEEICVEHCDQVTKDTCWDECQDDCETVCQDETVCDDEGNCWTETVCEDECTTTCETVCGPVVEEECYDECWVETYEQCDDVCFEPIQECGWVTRTYTSYPELAEVVAARAEIVLRDGEGQPHVAGGVALESRQARSCEGERCEPINAWTQRDTFHLPFAP